MEWSTDRSEESYTDLGGRETSMVGGRETSLLEIQKNQDMGGQSRVWGNTLDQTIEQFVKGALSAPHTQDRLIKLCEEMQCCRTPTITLELVVIFNLQTLGGPALSGSVLNMLQNSMERLVLMWNPVSRIYNSLDLWQRMDQLTRCVAETNDIGREDSILILSTLSSLAVQCRPEQGLQHLLQSLHRLHQQARKREAGSTVHRIMDRFTPLELVDMNHVENIYKLNHLVLSIVQSPSEVEDDDVKRLAEQEGFQSLSAFFLFLQCVQGRTRAGSQAFQDHLRNLLRTDSSPKDLRVEGYLLKGLSLFDEGSNQMALAAFYKVLQLCPGNVPALTGAHRVFARANNLKCEIETLKLIVKSLNSEHLNKKPDYLPSLVSLVAPHTEYTPEESLLLLADRLLLAGDPLQAAKAYLACLHRLEKNPAGISICEVRLGAALSLLMAGNPAEALVVLKYIESTLSRKRKLDSHSTDLISSFISGEAYLALDQHVRSLYYLDRALSSCGRSAEAGEASRRKILRLSLASAKEGAETTDTERSEALNNLTLLRCRIYVVKSKVYQAMQDRVSYTQCLETALTLHPTPNLLTEYIRHQESVGNTDKAALASKDLDRLKTDIAEVPRDGRMAKELLPELDTISLCIQYVYTGLPTTQFSLSKDLVDIS